MSRYRLDPSAKADLEEIRDNVSMQSLSAADRILDTFRAKFRLLASQPLLGELRPELAPNLRSLVVGNYVVFYRPMRGGVEIARIIHSARDIHREV